MADMKKELDELRDIAVTGCDIDEHPAQKERREKAGSKRCAPLSIDRENQCGTFKGSKGGVYETTLTECTCRDFMLRRFPCKHIYRLRHELGLSSLDDEIERHKDEVFVDPSVKIPEIIAQLSHDEQCELCVLLGQWIYSGGTHWVYETGEPFSTHFMKMGLLVEETDPAVTLRVLPFAVVRDAIKATGNKCPRTFAEAAPLAAKLCPELLAKAREKALCLVCAEWLRPFRGKLRSALADLIGDELYEFDEFGYRNITWKLHTR